MLIVSSAVPFKFWKQKSAIISVVNAFQLKSYVIGVTFVSERRMQYLNREHRRVNKATDILTFRVQGSPLMGEMFIAPRYVQKQCRKSLWPLELRLKRLYVHGMAHLLGHDHETRSEFALMHKLESEIARKLPGKAIRL